MPDLVCPLKEGYDMLRSPLDDESLGVCEILCYDCWTAAEENGNVAKYEAVFEFLNAITYLLT